MQNFLWASLDNFCLKLKISNLQHLQNGKINFIFLRACFEAIELLASKTAYSGVFFFPLIMHRLPTKAQS